ncbi:MAG: GNAT family N-acetyltransferase [Actinomycetota bacterium]|nr:GNAT family N-acetyltransferase [Actinomycetota bacterium]
MLERFDPLRTPRLVLEPISRTLAQAIATGEVGDFEAAEGWPQPGTVNGVRFALERGHPAGWLVRSGGAVIGDCGIHAPVDGAGCVEIGYGLAEPFRHQGLGTEVVQAISDWLLAQPAVTTLRASVEPSNIASCRVLEKAGFLLLESTGGLSHYARHAR